MMQLNDTKLVNEKQLMEIFTEHHHKAVMTSMINNRQAKHQISGHINVMNRVIRLLQQKNQDTSKLIELVKNIYQFA